MAEVMIKSTANINENTANNNDFLNFTMIWVNHCIRLRFLYHAKTNLLFGSKLHKIHL